MVDLAHIVAHLNKLDVGHDSRLLLSGAGDGALPSYHPLPRRHLD